MFLVSEKKYSHFSQITTIRLLIIILYSFAYISFNYTRVTRFLVGIRCLLTMHFFTENSIHYIVQET